MRAVRWVVLLNVVAATYDAVKTRAVLIIALMKFLPGSSIWMKYCWKCSILMAKRRASGLEPSRRKRYTEPSFFAFGARL